MQFVWLEHQGLKAEDCSRIIRIRDWAVTTRSGLRQDLQLVFHYLPFKHMGVTLDACSPGGGLATFMGVQQKCCAYYHFLLNESQLARLNMQANQVAEQSIYLEPDVLDIGASFDTVVLFAHYSSAANKELMQQCLNKLNRDGQLFVVLHRRYRLDIVQDELERLTGKRPEIIAANDQYCLLRAAKTREVAQPNPVWLEFSADLRGYSLSFVTRYEVFGGGRADLGSLALIEEMTVGLTDRVCDLGCGCGPIGLTAACMAAAGEVDMVDINVRAVAAARKNAENNYIYNASIGLSNGFESLAGRTYDLVVSNPPYHSDYAVGKRFIEGAYHRLNQGGKLLLVVKRPDWYARKVKSTFGNIQLIDKSPYTVLKAVKL